MRHFTYRTILLFSLLIIVHCINAQSIERSVFGSAGKSTASMDYTIGETFTATINNTNTIITQGFHQTKLIETGILEPDSYFLVDIYPNPTRFSFRINMRGISSPVELIIHDLQGNLVMNYHSVNSFQDIDVGHLAAGTYIVETRLSNGEEIAHHRLIKL